MCYVQIVMAVVAVVSSIASNMSKNKAAQKQADALNKQGEIRSEEIADAAGAKLDERARAARQERAAARVAASESGIGLGSNSFLAMLQASELDQSADSGLIIKDHRNQQRANTAAVQSSMSGLQLKSKLGMFHESAAAGFAAYTGSGGSTGPSGGGGLSSMGSSGRG